MEDRDTLVKLCKEVFSLTNTSLLLEDEDDKVSNTVDILEKIICKLNDSGYLSEGQKCEVLSNTSFDELIDYELAYNFGDLDLFDTSFRIPQVQTSAENLIEFQNTLLLPIIQSKNSNLILKLITILMKKSLSNRYMISKYYGDFLIANLRQELQTNFCKDKFDLLVELLSTNCTPSKIFNYGENIELLDYQILAALAKINPLNSFLLLKKKALDINYPLRSDSATVNVKFEIQKANINIQILTIKSSKTNTRLVTVELIQSGIRVSIGDYVINTDFDYIPTKQYFLSCLYNNPEGEFQLYIDGELLLHFNKTIDLPDSYLSFGSVENNFYLKIFNFGVSNLYLTSDNNKTYDRYSHEDCLPKADSSTLATNPNHSSYSYTASDFYLDNSQDILKIFSATHNDKKIMYYNSSDTTQALLKCDVFSHVFHFFEGQAADIFFTTSLPIFFKTFINNPILNNHFESIHGYAKLSYLITTKIVNYEKQSEVVELLFSQLSNRNKLHVLDKAMLTDLLLPVFLWENLDNTSFDTVFEKINSLCDEKNKFCQQNIQILEQEDFLPRILDAVKSANGLVENNAKEFTTCLHNILQNNNNSFILNQVLRYLYYELKINTNTTIANFILETLDTVFYVALKTLNIPVLKSIERTLTLKSILMLIDVSVSKHCEDRSVIRCISMLLKYLGISINAQKSFEKDGSLVLLAIFEHIDVSVMQALIKMLYARSFERTLDFVQVAHQNKFYQSDMSFDKEYVPLNFLIINILIFFDNYDENLIQSYVVALTEYVASSTKCKDFLLFEDSRILSRLILLATVTKHTNARSKITEFMINLITDSITFFKNSKMLLFFKNLEILSPFSSHTKKNIVKSFLSTDVFPEVISRINQFGDTFFVIKLENSDFLKNLLSLSTLMEEFLSYCSWKLIDLCTAFNLLLLFIETGTADSVFTKREAKILNSTLLKSLFLCLNSESKDAHCYDILFKSMLTYQGQIFKNGEIGTIPAHFIPCILSFIGLLHKEKDYTSTYAVSCFRTIILYREDEIKELAKSFLKLDKQFPASFFSDSLSASDDELRNLLQQENVIFAKYFDYEFKKQFTKSSVLSHFNLNAIKGLNAFEPNFHNVQRELFSRDLKHSSQLLSIFKNDNITTDGKLISAEHSRRLLIQEDHIETIIFYREEFTNIALSLNILKMSYENHDRPVPTQWCLARNSNIELMKKILIMETKPIPKFTSNTKAAFTPVESSTSQKKSRMDSIGSVEIISHIQALELGHEISNKNRKVLRNLIPNETVLHIWNTCLVVGLNIQEGIFILGENSCYFINNFFYSELDRKVIELEEVARHDRDDIIQLISSGTNHASKEIYLDADEKLHEVTKFSITQLAYVIKRPFLLRDLAAELILENKVAFFFSFKSSTLRDSFYQKMEKAQQPQLLEDQLLRSVFNCINSQNEKINIKNGLSSGSFAWKFTSTVQGLTEKNTLNDITEKWQKGEISNFFYLLIINLLSGRSFNDLTQYPVFPWVLSDYSSKTLNLQNPEVFRDLSKPMGAQELNRRNQFIERFAALQELNDPKMIPFHYGTHYSSAMIVASYLIRLEPYTSSYMLLQGQKIGPPDRLFNSIERAWESCSKKLSTDVRELIPEFFYLPEFLDNVNDKNFGTLQNGKKVGSVELPLWAKNDPKLFIQKNREALESDYVSKHLHKWIDLIFGYKQKGPAAVSAVNVFNELSYPGAVNLEAINDAREKQTITSIIHNFGQTPLQIFEDRHPEKYIIHLIRRLTDVLLPEHVEVRQSRFVNPSDMLYRIEYTFEEKLGILWSAYQISNFKLNSTNQLTIDGFKLWVDQNLLERSEIKYTAFTKIDDDCFATGNSFGEIVIWKLGLESYKFVYRLLGHLYAIKDIVLCFDSNILLSMDDSGKALQWDLSSGKLISSIGEKCIERISVSQISTNIVTIENTVLKIFNINRSKYLEKNLMETPTSVSFAESKSSAHLFNPIIDVIILGYENGTLEVHAFETFENGWNLRLIKTLKTGKGRRITTVKSVLKTNLLKKQISLEICAGDDNSYLYIWK